MDLLAVSILIVFAAFYLLVVVPMIGGWLWSIHGGEYGESLKLGGIVHVVISGLVAVGGVFGWAAVTVFK